MCLPVLTSALWCVRARTRTAARAGWRVAMGRAAKRNLPHFFCPAPFLAERRHEQDTPARRSRRVHHAALARSAAGAPAEQGVHQAVPSPPLHFPACRLAFACGRHPALSRCTRLPPRTHAHAMHAPPAGRTARKRSTSSTTKTATATQSQSSPTPTPSRGRKATRSCGPPCCSSANSPEK